MTESKFKEIVSSELKNHSSFSEERLGNIETDLRRLLYLMEGDAKLGIEGYGAKITRVALHHDNWLAEGKWNILCDIIFKYRFMKFFLIVLGTLMGGSSILSIINIVQYIN